MAGIFVKKVSFSLEGLKEKKTYGLINEYGSLLWGIIRLNIGKYGETKEIVDMSSNVDVSNDKSMKHLTVETLSRPYVGFASESFW